MARRGTFMLENGSTLHIVTTDRDDGDFGLRNDPNSLEARRLSLCEPRWSFLTQVHGREIVEIIDDAVQGDEGDGLITACANRPLAVQTADCAPVVLYGPGPWFGVVHVGWRGLVAGIVESAIERIAERGGVVDAAWVGPNIGAECYAFSRDDLLVLEKRFGESVAAQDAHGEPSLDLRAALAVEMTRCRVDRVEMSEVCTACSRDHFSHRARGDIERMATVAWTQP